MIFFMMMFLSVALPVGIIMYARIVRPLKLRLKFRILFGLLTLFIVLIAGIATPLALFIGKDADLAHRIHFDIWGGWPYYVIVFLWTVVVCLLIRGVIVYGVRFCRWCAARRQKKSVSENDFDEAQSPLKVDENRRNFLEYAKQAATVGAACVLVPPVVYDARGNRRIRHVEIVFEDLPDALDGLRIAHLSDIHVGMTMYRENVADIVRETNALSPDIIAITGDLADGYPEVIGDWIDPMRDFKSKYGAFFVTGNHDHMWNARGWMKKVESVGIVALDNAHVLLDVKGTPVAIAGAIDARGDRFGNWQSEPEKALRGIEANIFKIMLVHQPASVDRSLAAGADLVLLGHTHGGQIWPLTYLIDRIHRYARGLYRVENKAVYVSCGTGYWGPPLRVGVPPEIIDIQLKKRTL